MVRRYYDGDQKGCDMGVHEFAAYEGGVVCNSDEWVGCYMRGQSDSCGPRAGGHKGDSIVGEVGSGCVEEGERDKDRHGGYEIHRPIAS